MLEFKKGRWRKNGKFASKQEVREHLKKNYRITSLDQVKTNQHVGILKKKGIIKDKGLVRNSIMYMIFTKDSLKTGRTPDPLAEFRVTIWWDKELSESRMQQEMDDLLILFPSLYPDLQNHLFFQSTGVESETLDSDDDSRKKGDKERLVIIKKTDGSEMEYHEDDIRRIEKTQSHIQELNRHLRGSDKL